MVERLELKVNGPQEAVSVSGETPLLYVLRNDFGLNGPKFSCGLSQCGTCAESERHIEKDGVGAHREAAALRRNMPHRLDA